METLVIFQVGSLRLGIDGDQVAQILRLPPITPVPLASPEVLGVSIVDGKVCQNISLARLLDQPEVSQQDAARLITVHHAHELIGFPADTVLETVEVDQAHLEHTDAAQSFITGLYHHNGETVQLIDLAPLLEESRIAPLVPCSLPIPLPNKEKTGQDEPERMSGAQTSFYLLFRLGRELFAVESHGVRELIFANGSLTPVAGAAAEVLGVIELREQLLSVVDLPALMGFEAFSHHTRARFLVLEAQDFRVALAVDEVLEAREIDRTAIERVAFDDDERLEGVVRLEDGRVVTLLSQFYLQQLMKQYGMAREAQQAQASMQLSGGPMIELAVFRIDQEHYAFEIEQVREIIRYQPITPIPDPPPFVEGIINLRGRVIPVVNLPERLGFSFKPTEQSKIIVGLLGEDQVGFLVDEVDDILSVSEDACTYNDDVDGLVYATITLEEGKRVILWLKLERVLTPPVRQFIQQKKES